MTTETIISILEKQIADSRNGIVEITDKLALEIINKLFNASSKRWD